MLTFHQVRLASVSLAGAVAHEGKRVLSIQDDALTISEVLNDALASSCLDLAKLAQSWAQDAGRSYLLPVVAEFERRTFGGYIDTVTSVLAIQCEVGRTRQEAMRYALSAAHIRSTSDRSFNHLPTRVVPFARDFGELLRAAPVSTQAVRSMRSLEVVT